MREDGLILSQALRGAADSFGIVTSFYLATKPAPATVVQWSFTIPDMFTSAAKSTSAFLHIQDFARNAAVVDRKIAFGIYMDGGVFLLRGTYFGTLDTFNNKVCKRWSKRLVIRLTNQPTDQTRTLAGPSDSHRFDRSGN